MDVRITNTTGKNLYYRVLDYEGPFMHFGEDRLPGMYPGPQSDFTDSDAYYSGTNTIVGDRRHTLSSRYPKFSQPKSYMSNFADGQRPTERSYSEVQHNYPDRDGNREGVIPSGKTRDLMLTDGNCNIQFRTIGPPVFDKIVTEHYDLLEGSALMNAKPGLQPNDPRVYDYEGVIKAARLRETHLIMCLRYGNWNFMYNESGQRFTSQYPQDCTFMALIRTVPGPQTAGRINLAEPYPYASIDALPSPSGTYIDRLRTEAAWRKFEYSKRNPNMHATNYSDDYDKPILGYFDRRWLYKNNYIQ
jgi:hypothetical protein